MHARSKAVAEPLTRPVSTRLVRRRGALIALLLCAGATIFGLWLGPYKRALLAADEHFTMIPTTFEVWDKVALSKHLMLAFNGWDDFEQHRAYHHYSPAWLVLLYLLLKPLHLLGIPYSRGQHALVVLNIIPIALVIYTQFDTLSDYMRRPVSARSAFLFIMAVIALCSVVTLPSFWIAALAFNPEQFYFIPALAFSYLSVLDFRGRTLSTASFVAMVFVVLFAPLYAPFALISLAILWGLARADSTETANPNSEWKRRIAILCFIGAASIVVPYMMVKLGNFKGTGSPLSFRSGLDGDQRYFSNMIQAVLKPYDASGRQWHFLHLPIIAILASLAMFPFSRFFAGKMLRQLFISWIPYFWMIVVFPQVVSVHPYLFDFNITFGSVFCMSFWLIQPEMDAVLESRPLLVLSILILFVGLLMTNYIDLARFSRHG